MEQELAVQRPRFEMVPHWVIDHPNITGNAVRLYLLLRRYSDSENRSFPSRKRLSNDLNVALATVDSARDVLVAIGALTVTPRYTDSGDQTSNLYVLQWDSPLPESRRPPYQNLDDPLGRNVEANSYPSYSDSTNQDTAAPSESETQRAQRLTKVYTNKVPLSKFPAVMGIVKKALKAGYSDQQITIALEGLADDGRPVTVDSLRIQMEGLPATRSVTALDRKRNRQREVLAKYSGTEAIGS